MEYDGVLGVITEEITIQVVNKNIHMPIFQNHPKTFEIKENTPVGSLIYHFSATDLDHDTLSFRVTNFGESPLYRIGLKTGDLYVNEELDYETSKVHNLIVSVSDGTYSRSTAITIKLLNINDNKPYFLQQKYSVSITEIRERKANSINPQGKTTVVTSIIDIQVNDKDPGSRISLEIIGGDEMGLFGIKETKLYAKSHLPIGVYQLHVMATDEKGLRSLTNAEVEINVIKNPYRITPTPTAPPFKVFNKKLYEVSVKETLNVGAIVFGYDLPLNSSKHKIQFELKEIERSKYNILRIDQSGVVYLASKLDLDVSRKHYFVVSACAENNNCQLCHLTINVIEDENSLPRFHVKAKEATLPYDSRRNTLITALIFRGRIKDEISFKVNITDGEEINTYLKTDQKTVQLFLNSSFTNTTINFINFNIDIVFKASGELIDRCKLRVNLFGNGAGGVDAMADQSLNNLPFDVLNWKYMVPFVSLILILVILVVVLLLLYHRVQRFVFNDILMIQLKDNCFRKYSC